MANYEDTKVLRGYDPTQGDEWRVNGVPVIPLSALTGTISYTDSTVQLGTVPANAVVLGVIVDIDTAFNDATNNILTVGTAADDDLYLAAGDVDETVAGGTAVWSKSGAVSTDTAIFAKYASGGAASAGAARVTVLYAVPPA